MTAPARQAPWRSRAPLGDRAETTTVRGTPVEITAEKCSDGYKARWVSAVSLRLGAGSASMISLGPVFPTAADALAAASASLDAHLEHYGAEHDRDA